MSDTTQKTKFSINDFFSKCDQCDLVTLTEKSLMENFSFCAVRNQSPGISQKSQRNTCP